MPVTNFFGSVMETIHTDSAYRVLSSKESKKDKIKMPSKQSYEDRRRTLSSSDVQPEIRDSDTTVSALIN